MREAIVEGPNGEEIVLDVPDDASNEDIMAFAKDNYKQFNQAKEGERELTFGEVASGAAENLFPSAIKLGNDLYQAVRHPIDTAGSLLDLGKGIVQLAVPGEQGDEETARAVGRMMAKRYGGWKAIKKTMATDPVGFISDLSMFLTGGGTAIAKAGQVGGKLAKTYGQLPQMVRQGIKDMPIHDAGTMVKRGQMGNQLSRGGKAGPDLPVKPNFVERFGQGTAKLGSTIDPMRQTGRLIGYGARKAGNIATDIQGSLTGVGQDVMKQTFSAGLRNSKAWKQGFKYVEDADVLVNEARDNIRGLKHNAQKRYKRDFKKMVDSAPPTDWRPVAKKFNELADSTFDAVTGEYSLIDDVAEMEKLKRIEFHVRKVLSDPKMQNAAGYDYLKKMINKVKISDDMDVAKRVQAELSDAVKSEIVKVYDAYDGMMDQYSGFKSLQSELASAFGKDKHTSLDATLRKLQAAMRNQVNTSMGNKRQLLREIDPTQSLADKISGQAVRKVTPRGMAGKIGPMGVAGMGAYGGAGAGGALFGLESPNIMGRTNFLAGQIASPADKIGKAIGPKGGRALSQGLIQAGRVKQIDDEVDYEMTLKKQAPKKKKRR
jgi:hypothetical protein